MFNQNMNPRRMAQGGSTFSNEGLEALNKVRPDVVSKILGNPKDMAEGGIMSAMDERHDDGHACNATGTRGQ